MQQLNLKFPDWTIFFIINFSVESVTDDQLSDTFSYKILNYTMKKRQRF